MRDEIYVYSDGMKKIPITDEERKNTQSANYILDSISMLFPVDWVFTLEIEAEENKLNDFLKKEKIERSIKIEIKDNFYFIISQKHFESCKKQRITTMVNELKERLLPPVATGFLASLKSLQQRKFDLLQEQWKQCEMDGRELKGMRVAENSRCKPDLREPDQKKAEMLNSLIKYQARLTKLGEEFLKKNQKPKDSGVKDLSRWDKKGDPLPIPGRDKNKLYDISPDDWQTAQGNLIVRDKRKLKKDGDIKNVISNSTN